MNVLNGDANTETVTKKHDNTGGFSSGIPSPMNMMISRPESLQAALSAHRINYGMRVLVPESWQLGIFQLVGMFASALMMVNFPANADQLPGPESGTYIEYVTTPVKLGNGAGMIEYDVTLRPVRVSRFFLSHVRTRSCYPASI